jgi:membrane dipeptidase
MSASPSPAPAGVPIFDGHNDALTSPRGRDLASAHADGHLDLPRMRSGHVRGGCFAIFASSGEDDHDPTRNDDGVLSRPMAARISHPDAAAAASAAAGRLFALERSGAVRMS